MRTFIKFIPEDEDSYYGKPTWIEQIGFLHVDPWYFELPEDHEGPCFFAMMDLAAFQDGYNTITEKLYSDDKTPRAINIPTKSRSYIFHLYIEATYDLAQGEVDCSPAREELFRALGAAYRATRTD